MRENRGSHERERLEIHNTSVDEQVARAHLCGHVHLPTGATCTLPEAHPGSCRFASPDQAHDMARSEAG